MKFLHWKFSFELFKKCDGNKNFEISIKNFDRDWSYEIVKYEN